MATDPLANLARIGQLKTEARNPAEVSRMLRLAKTRLDGHRQHLTFNNDR